jgi:hypothetical protein
MNRETLLLRRVRWLTWLFILGLVMSGITAIPLVEEVRWIANLAGTSPDAGADHYSAVQSWMVRVEAGLLQTQQELPFLFYGTDWLAFGHIIIALAFVNALRHPVRNRWLFDFGLTACALVIPWATVFGAVRGIPWWWRMADCMFGVLGAVPLWFCRKWAKELELMG